MRFGSLNNWHLIVWQIPLFAGLGLAACDRPAPAPGPPPSPPAASQREIGQLGVRVTLPPGGVVGNATLSSGALITGGGVGATVIRPADSGWPRTAAEAISSIASLDPREVRAETLADGWIVTFENGPVASPNYWFEGRRAPGGRPLMCTSTVTVASQRDRGADVCRSLSE